MNSEDFFQNLPKLTNFNHITSKNYYREVPDDWFLYITDIKNSTQAISEGRYKEVNILGAACIILIRNVMNKKDFPFIFGGDGATLLVPSSKVSLVDQELAGLRFLAKNNFNLELRIGKISVKELKDKDLKLEVANYQIASGQNLPMLRGNGLEIAEKWIKQRTEDFEIKTPVINNVDLNELSCRWEPIPSKRGKILSLIITSRCGEAIYEKILKDFQEIFPEGIESHNPVNYELGNYKSFFQLVKEELKLHKNPVSFNFSKRLFQIFAAVIIFKYKLPLPIRTKYIQSLSTHSDFRKFDNSLRMIIDCTITQIEKLEDKLKTYHQKNEIFYGTFLADNCLMTCLFEGLNQGEHLHFIDGDNGGYAMAALQLKEQIKTAKSDFPKES